LFDSEEFINLCGGEEMKITVGIIKADIGSIGGHIKPSQELIETVSNYINERWVKAKELIDYRISSTGDDIAILMTHKKGTLNEKIHRLAWDVFVAGTEVAKEQGLYGAGQDLLKDAFSGNVKGMVPAVAEMEIEERPNECFIQFAADKTDPGAYNLPFYLAFTDPMYYAGLMLSPSMSKGFKYVIMEVEHAENVKGMSPTVSEPSEKVKKRKPRIIKNKTVNEKPKVFIVHGHNEVVTAKVKDFVRERLGLTPLILAEQPDEGLTIIQKFEKHARTCCFAIVILTKDDMTKEGHVRPGLNAIFELGYFQGKYGRKRTVLLKEKNVKMPSDLSGLVYKGFDDNKVESCLDAIRLELENAHILPLQHNP